MAPSVDPPPPARETGNVAAFDAETACIMLTWACNNRCTFCDLHADDRPRGAAALHHPAPGLEEVRRLIDEAAAGGASHLELGGGEPTLLPYLADVIAHARERFWRISTVSNGRAFADRELTRRLLDAGLNRVMISLHGSCAAVHDSLCGREGAFAELSRGLHNLIAEQAERPGLSLWVTTTVVPTNLPDLVALGHLLRRLGVRNWLLRNVAGPARVRPYAEIRPSLSDAIAAHRDALAIQTENLPLCALGPFAVHSSAFQRTAAVGTRDHAAAAAAPATAQDIGLEPCRACAAAPICRGPEATYRKAFGARDLAPLDAAALAALQREREVRPVDPIPVPDHRRAPEDGLCELARRREWRALRRICLTRLAADPTDARLVLLKRTAEARLIEDEAARRGAQGNEAGKRRLLARLRADYADLL